MSVYVYCHRLKSTGVIVYYGCGSISRSRVKTRTSKIHENLMRSNLLDIELLESFNSRKEAEECETLLINISRAVGNNELFNIVADKVESGKLYGSIAGKIGGAVATRVQREKGIGLFDPKNKSIGGRASVNSGKGIHAPEGKSLGGLATAKLGKGIHLPGAQSKAGKKGGSTAASIINGYVDKCLECGKTSTPAGIALHQRKVNHQGKARLIGEKRRGR